MKQPGISYVVSCYDRPADLRVCLSSLAAQRYKNHQIIVTDNADDLAMFAQNKEIAQSWGATYLKTNGPTCYHSAEEGAKVARGEYLCFPSDDSYYVPFYAWEMLKAARDNDADLVFSDMVYGRWPHMKYEHWVTEPRLNRIDKTNFLVRRSVFTGFPQKPDSAIACACDGHMVDELVARGAKVVGVAQPLCVHN